MNQAASMLARFWQKAEPYVAHRPWRCAVLTTPVIFVLLTCCFQPAYETNDDPVIAMIAAGKFFSLEPDEHLIFTHPYIGLMLKSLYTHVPSMPWYGLYLLATQATAHVVVTGLLFLYAPLRRALRWLAVWLGTVGIYLITHLQFTTTAFLAGMAGVLLLWEAARRVCARLEPDSNTTINQAASAPVWPQTPRSIIGLVLAGSALLLWCEMIRWYMFYLMVVMPIPAIGLWWFFKRPGWLVTAKTAGFAALLVLAGLGLKALHLAYYHADPEWREFYEYNDLRAQFNDTIKVVYNEQTRGSFEEAGWTHIDMQMIQAWCYDDPTVYSREKLQQILDSRAWQAERQSLKKTLLGMIPLMKERPMRIGLFLLIALSFLVPIDRRNFSFNTVVLFTAFGMLLLLSIFQKSPPSRVYVPIVVWAAVATAWNYLNRSLADAAATPALSARQIWQYLLKPEQRAATPAIGLARAICLAVVTILVPVGTVKAVHRHYLFHVQRDGEQQVLHSALDSFAPTTSKLYIVWASSIPVENLDPLNSLAQFNNYRTLFFGWTQQMPTHRTMQERYGIANLLQEWTEHPEVEVICPQICTEYYAKYVKEHYALDVRAVPAGKFLDSPIYRFQNAADDVVSEKQKLTRTE